MEARERVRHVIARSLLAGAVGGLVVSALGLGAGYSLLTSKADGSDTQNRLGALEAQARQTNDALGAEANRESFAGKWDTRYPMISKSWRANWSRIVPMFGFPEEIRRAVYTTNAIESVNAQLRKIVKTRGHFPTDEAATKLLWLALRNITADWSRAAHDWKAAMNQFAILYEDRFTRSHL